jgi:hypothetical protein
MLCVSQPLDSVVDICRLDMFHSEGTTGRALPNDVTTPGGPAKMTVDLCTSACQAAGYVLAGVEYAQECCKCFRGHPIYDEIAELIIAVLFYRVW